MTKQGLFIDAYTTNDHQFSFDINCVESYLYVSDDIIRVYFKSGNYMDLMKEVDQEIYPGDDLGTLLDIAVNWFNPSPIED